MIEGLKLKVTSAELRSHLTERSAHHTERARCKSEELVKLREIAERLKPEVNPESLAFMNKLNASNYRMDPNDVCESLESDIRDHNNKALMFTFYAGHLFDEDYTLKEDDLKRLEILK